MEQADPHIGDLSRVERRNGSGSDEMPSWSVAVLTGLKTLIEASNPQFPCLYGTRALRTGALRYTLVEDTDDAALDCLAMALERYVCSVSTRPEITSLLAVFPPDSTQLALDDYRRRFWKVLEQLHERDPCPWPSHIPSDPEEHLWEFCFAGEAMFVFAACPAYERRRSRRTETFTIAFQPRYMFDRLFEKPIQLERARALIQRRVVAFDDVPPHPDLGLYHDPGNREWRQYVIPDTNEPIKGCCPLPRA